MRRSLGLGIALCLLTISSVSSARTEKRGNPLSPREQQLHKAALLGQLDEVRALIDGGVSPNVSDAQQRTPMMWAAFNGHEPIVVFLLEQGADSTRIDEKGRTALMYAAAGPNYKLVDLLARQEGARIDLQDRDDGFTALMFAASQGQAKVVEVLLGHGADPTIRNGNGESAVQFAARNGHTRVVDELAQALEAPLTGER